jgi:thiol-disulfide isomerase/thioredoxin
MHPWVVGLAVIVVVAANVYASAETLCVGDSAPQLCLSRVIKGDIPDKLDPDRTYVVEFWATWCGPCIASIPHLTELQKKYGKVQFIGVSVWEEDQRKVEPFVKEQGEKMGYTVALDDVAQGKEGDKGKTAGAWMTAAGEDAVPCAFVVQKRKIAWIGHPLDLDKPLEKIVAGDWNLAAAAKEAVALIDKSVAADPKLEEVFAQKKFKLLRQSGDDEAIANFGGKLAATFFKENPQLLNFVAWQIVDPEKRVKAGPMSLKLALQAATRANELAKGERSPILDTLAKVYFDLGDPAKAAEYEEKAVKHSTGERHARQQERLEQYRKAAGQNH